MVRADREGITLVSFTCEPLSVPLREPFVIASGRMDATRAVAVRAEVAALADGDGVGVGRRIATGWGEAAALPPVTWEDQPELLALLSRATPALAGRKLESAQALGALLDPTFPTSLVARAAVETAILDGWARLADEPLSRWLAAEGEADETHRLGSTGRPAAGAPTLITDITLPIASPDHMAALARGYRGRGFVCFKVKVGRDWKSDVRGLLAVADAVPDARFRLDANAGFHEPEAWALLDTALAAGMTIECFEQPCAREDWAGMARLTARAPIPIVADESFQGAADLERIARERAASGVNLKLVKLGGPLAALSLGRRARQLGLRLMAGAMVETRLGLLAMAHVVSALGGVGRPRHGVLAAERALHRRMGDRWSPPHPHGGGRPRRRPLPQPRRLSAAARRHERTPRQRGPSMPEGARALSPPAGRFGRLKASNRVGLRVVAEKSSAKILETALADFRGALTVADASTRSGLPLRDAEEGLRVLAADFSGHLAATSKGELIYSFPGGLVRPPETRLLRRVGAGLARVALGTARLLVRAWVSVVLVGYALLFLAILIALALRGSDDRDGPSPMDGIGTVVRIIAEALFWTFHPWSPVMIGSEPGWLHAGPRRRRLPFYERVNRFVFGPPKAKVDPREQERQVLAEIRRQKGRIAPGDVMRITGASREDAERQLLRLVVDYEGDLGVSDSGVVLYTFTQLRTTTTTAAAATEGRAPLARPVWNTRAELAPLTGNTAGSNLLFTFINGFNLVASGFVLANGLTLERLTALFSQLRTVDPVSLPPPEGLPLVLGAIPFAFSLALFALPLLRALRRPAEGRRIARENGWRGLLRTVLDRPPEEWRTEYTDDEIRRAWTAASGRAPAEDELRDAIRALGGDTELNADGILVYRFETASREIEALLRERARATDAESAAGQVIFSSADAGTGIRDDAERPATYAKPPSPTAFESDPSNEKSPDAGASAAVPQLEGRRETLEFIDRLMAESSKRRRE